MDNLVTSCQPCNLGKSAKSLTEIPQSLKDKAADIKERELQITGFQQVMQGKLDRIEREKWRVAEALVHGSPEDGMRKDWLKSISMFIGKLGMFPVIDAAEIANARFGYSKSKMFSYFCGRCWSKVREAN